ncbi:flavin reductase family protein [Nocardioides panacisoli]|uniref:Flavin reductase family protein n=1 Tax=Nocardioides panacisoli TaxID=627624 RepID=A0ABP7IN67_9ACTN
MADRAFGDLVASADPPLVVVTTAAAGEQSGCLVGFHAQSSIEPERYSVWLSKANHTYRVALRSAYFGLHFLTADDLAVAEHFGTLSGEDVDKFAGVDVEVDQHGVPLLTACPHRMLLARTAILDDGGDHVCLTTRVLLAQSSGRFRPLRVSAAAHLDAGHDADERAIEP